MSQVPGVAPRMIAPLRAKLNVAIRLTLLD
jgi:hypothetical protein